MVKNQLLRSLILGILTLGSVASSQATGGLTLGGDLPLVISLDSSVMKATLIGSLAAVGIFGGYKGVSLIKESFSGNQETPKTNFLSERSKKMITGSLLCGSSIALIACAPRIVRYFSGL